MPIWRGIEFLWNTPADGQSGLLGSFFNDQTRVENSIQVRDWAGLPDAIWKFTGSAAVAGSTGARYIERLTPMPLPDFLAYQTLQPWLWCVGISRVEGLSTDGNTVLGGPSYLVAMLRLVHTNLSYEILEDGDPAMQFMPHPGYPGEVPPVPAQPNPTSAGKPDEATLNRFITRQVRGFNRSISLPRALPRFVLESGDESPSPVVFESIGKPEPGEMLRYTWHLVPRSGVPRDRIREAMGCVNQYDFDGYPRGTLLFESPDVVPLSSPNGQRLADVHYNFRFLGKRGKDGLFKGWNYLFRQVKRTSGPPILDYRKVTTDGLPTSDTPFRFYDFSSLFRPV